MQLAHAIHFYWPQLHLAFVLELQRYVMSSLVFISRYVTSCLFLAQNQSDCFSILITKLSNPTLTLECVQNNMIFVAGGV